jgi:8-amino-7-oxononanoate synthase
MQDLRKHLYQQRHLYRRSLIITDSVFSMDGDLCPLPALLNLATEFNSMLLLDEAHATGVLGNNGAGCVAHWGCTGQELIQMGTLSKALGSLGGYVTGSPSLIDFLRNRAPSWIYTTALSPADTAAAVTAIEIIQQEPQHREQLWHNVNYLKETIDQHLPNLQLLPSQSPILCFQLANATKAMEVGKYLKKSGIFAPAIRPPTVPTSRIRISVMATHKKVHLDRLLEVLEQVSISTLF